MTMSTTCSLAAGFGGSLNFPDFCHAQMGRFMIAPFCALDSLAMIFFLSLSGISSNRKHPYLCLKIFFS